MFVITGATGNTGRILSELLLKNGRKIRVVARNSDKLKSLADRGVEVLSGSLEDSDFVSKAFSGAEAVYAMVPPNWTATDFRAYQNRVIDALALGIEKNRVPYVISLSSVGADVSDKTGPVSGLYDMEQRFNAIKDANVLHLRAGYFMENFMGNIGLIRMMGINAGAIHADLGVPLIASQDIGRYAAQRFVDLDFSGKSVQELQGQRDVSMNEATRILGQAIGKPDLKYVEMNYEDAINGMTQMGLPRAIAAMYVELSQAVNEGLVKFRQPRSASNSTPTTIEEFSKIFAAVYTSKA